MILCSRPIPVSSVSLTPSVQRTQNLAGLPSEKYPVHCTLSQESAELGMHQDLLVEKALYQPGEGNGTARLDSRYANFRRSATWRTWPEHTIL
jgi:hypothetical protein